MIPVPPAFANADRRGPALLATIPVVLLLVVLSMLAADHLSAYQKLLATAITVIGTLPMVSYARRPVGRYPMVQLCLLFHGLTYGAVCFSDNLDWLGMPDDVIDSALELALIGVAGLWIGSQLMPTAGAKPAGHRFGEVPLSQTLVWAVAFGLLGLLRNFVPLLNRIPTLPNILTAGLWISIALLMTALLRGEATPRQKAVLAVILVVEGAYRLASGALASLSILFLVLGFIYWRERGRMPVLPVVLAIATLAVFNPVKDTWRRQIWFSGENAGPIARLDQLIDLTQDYYFSGTRMPNDAAERNVNRLANVPTLAWVRAMSPRVIDHWNGYSYRTLLYSLVPRFLYPEKPTATIGNEFGRRYRLLDPYDSVTSYNLPWLVELYVNFGELAMLPGMLFFGILLARLTAAIGSASDLGFAIGLSATHQLFAAESDFSVMWGNVILVMIFFGVGARVVFRK